MIPHPTIGYPDADRRSPTWLCEWLHLWAISDDFANKPWDDTQWRLMSYLIGAFLDDIPYQDRKEWMIAARSYTGARADQAFAARVEAVFALPSRKKTK